MTINVAVVTSDALVLGCDSIASTTEYLVNPFSCEHEEVGDEGYVRVKVTPADIVGHVTNTWDGVTKMFPLHASPCPVAGVTAGLAKLCDRSMSSFANEFFSQHGGGHAIELSGSIVSKPQALADLRSVEEVAAEFLRFMRDYYDAHYSGSQLPEEYRDGPVFLIGGYGARDHLPSLYRVDVHENTVTCDCDAGRFGILWEGQSDAVERLLKGYDTTLRMRIEAELRAALNNTRERYADALARIVQKVLERLAPGSPADFSIELPQLPEIKLPWSRFATSIPCGDIPLQDAVNLAAYLVGLQSGKAHFSSGVPAIGGRTHIGVITKAKGFQMLDEPELRHTNVGFT